MTPGTVNVNGSVGFGLDRFNNTDGAILLNNSYYKLPTGVYFSGDFTILAWVKLNTYSSNSRLLDCGNGPSSDNVLATISNGNSGKPFVRVFNGITILMI